MGFISQGINSIFGSQDQSTLNTDQNTRRVNETYLSQQDAVAQQKAFLMALQQQGGIGNQSAVFQQQQALSQQLQAQAMGQGPNPVQAQLAQATGANTANQAALMAGQRGASANAGLIARQAANVGGANQQAMVGQAATLGAQQQLAAQQALMGQQQNMAGLATSQVGAEQNAQGMYGNSAIAGLNAANGMLANQQQINSGINSSNATRQNQITGGLLQAGGNIGMMAMSGGASAAAQGGGGGSGLTNMGGSGGGNQAVSAYAHGGMVYPDAGMKPATIARPDKGWGAIIAKADGGMIPNGPAGGPASRVGRYFMAAGGSVPGVAAPVPGDSPKNDTVPTMLSPGEIVIPRSVLQGADPTAAAASFVAAVLKKHGVPK